MVVAVLAIALVLAIWRPWQSDPSGGPAEPPTTPSGTPTSGESTTPQGGEEVAPGLTRGTVAVEASHSDAVYGVPVGYPQTVDGGIAAAINYDAAGYAPAMFNKKTRAILYDRIYTSTFRAELFTDKEWRQFHPWANDAGQVVDEKSGKVIDELRVISGCYPRYGAYRVINIQPDSAQPSEITISNWMPCVKGPGNDTDLSQVRLVWEFNTVTVRWEETDWRIAYSSSRTSRETQPEDRRVSNQTFAARAKVLGIGWQVPADATEEALPGAVFTR
ncbi:hypothetical protein [Microlunatus sp. Y2014]|uniref:hypothetical protein n=1 Tax=Microlunatus sp. Y2014 TaxID=3418488 RepID=UPI003DA73DE0